MKSWFLMLLATLPPLNGIFLGRSNEPVPREQFQPQIRGSEYGLTQHDISSVLQLHKQLVEIESVSENEYEISDFLHSVLSSYGLHVVSSYKGKRRNLLAYFPFDKKSSSDKIHKKLLLTSHLDTVPPYISYDFDEKTGVITGRGVNDAKSSVAIQVHSVLSLYSEGLLAAEDFALLFVVGEEIDGDGMKQAMKDFSNWSFDTVIFGEPTENKLGRGHKGNYMFDIQVTGVAAHSGYPELGVSANEILISILNKFLENSYKLPFSDILGPTTFNIGTINGGIAKNVIPKNATAGLFFRVAKDLDKVDDFVKDIVNGANSAWSEKTGIERLVQIQHLKTKQPQFLDYNVPGFESIALAYATDIPDFNLTTEKRFLYGPGSILTAHGDKEYITVQNLENSLEGYKKLILFNIGEN